MKFLLPCLTDPGNDEMSPAVELACSRLLLPHPQSIHVPVQVVPGSVTTSHTTSMEGFGDPSIAPVVLPAWCVEIVGPNIQEEAEELPLLLPVPSPTWLMPPAIEAPISAAAVPPKASRQGTPSNAASNKARLGCSCKRCQHCTYSRQLYRTVCARCRDKRCKCHVCGQTRRKVDHILACACTSALTKPSKRTAKLCSDALRPGGEVAMLINPENSFMANALQAPSSPGCSPWTDVALGGRPLLDLDFSSGNVTLNWADGTE